MFLDGIIYFKKITSEVNNFEKFIPSKGFLLFFSNFKKKNL